MDTWACELYVSIAVEREVKSRNLVTEIAERSRSRKSAGQCAEISARGRPRDGRHTAMRQIALE